MLFVRLSAVFAQYQNDMFVFNFDFIIKVKSVAFVSAEITSFVSSLRSQKYSGLMYP